MPWPKKTRKKKFDNKLDCSQPHWELALFHAMGYWSLHKSELYYIQLWCRIKLVIYV